MRGVGGFYTVMDQAGRCYTLRAQAKLRRQRLTPLVGDYVRFTLGEGEENSWLTAILPRRNSLIRPAVANIDYLVITLSAGFPKADLLLADRLLLLCRQAGISPLVAVNKAEEDPQGALALAQQYRGGAAGTFVLSAVTGQGVEALGEALGGTVHAFGGQSGVGKSTLINRLYGLELSTGALSEKIDRGKHTTRHTQLIQVPGGGKVLDTPGFSLLEMKTMDPAELAGLYPEFQPYGDKCRFQPCAHYKEPGCAVKEAVEAGLVSGERHGRYCELYEEMRERWRERYD